MVEIKDILETLIEFGETNREVNVRILGGALLQTASHNCIKRIHGTRREKTI